MFIFIPKLIRIRVATKVSRLLSISDFVVGEALPEFPFPYLLPKKDTFSPLAFLFVFHSILFVNDKDKKHYFVLTPNFGLPDRNQLTSFLILNDLK